MWKYHGTGEYIMGAGGRAVPPRDLSDDEYPAYEETIAANKAATGNDLYKHVADKAPAKTPAPVEAPADAAVSNG